MTLTVCRASVPFAPRITEPVILTERLPSDESCESGRAGGIVGLYTRL